MFYFLSRTLLHRRCTVTGSTAAQKLSLLQKLPFSQFSPKPILAKVNQHSSVISYLINACGLSPKSALSASKKLHFETSDRPNLVLSFFKDHGLSRTQISKIIGRTPELLLYYPEKTLLPKFEFFYSKGISSSDLAALMYTCPRVIITGLESKIVPSFNCLEELLKSKDKAIAAIKHFPFILCHDIEGQVAILRDHGVPDPNIALFVRRWPHLSISNPDKFNQTVEVVIEMGINPLKSQFVIAIVAVKKIGKDIWERKVNLYKSWGCSEEQIIASFTKFPWCMIASENKISPAMDFFVNKMGWEANAVVERPILISLSLEKRILPRAPVLQFVLSKGWLEEKVSKVAWMFTCPEKRFVRKCLTWHKYEPQLLQMYRDKLDLCKVREGSI
ncbi:Mitochondrial transcription termination factor family protein, putative [Theobroma cacao]|uniref:Mitochondrial transcription termination factor family protein, putative n=1 Tax=Theobroma cacao TaxID=3641 RepID=A0A061EN26_THECC|nr:Mitochondrial transcription termination factor family protein, putative [Theobroma cacao]